LSLEDKILLIFEIAELEGEDVTLEKLCSAFNVDVPSELKEYANLPPRIALALAYARSEFKDVIKRAAKRFMRDKLSAMVNVEH